MLALKIDSTCKVPLKTTIQVIHFEISHILEYSVLISCRKDLSLLLKIIFSSICNNIINEITNAWFQKYLHQIELKEQPFEK